MGPRAARPRRHRFLDTSTGATRVTPRERARIDYEHAVADEIVGRVLDKREHVIVPMRTLRAFAILWRSARMGTPCPHCYGREFHSMICPQFQSRHATTKAEDSQ